MDEGKGKKKKRMLITSAVCICLLLLLAAGTACCISTRFGELPDEAAQKHFEMLPNYSGGRFVNQEPAVMRLTTPGSGAAFPKTGSVMKRIPFSSKIKVECPSQ